MGTVEARASNPQRHDAVKRLVLSTFVIAAAFVLATIDVTSPGSPADWFRPADRFGPSPDGDPTAFVTTGVEAGDTVVALMLQSTDPVRLDAIEPVTDPTSALASVELVACRHREGTPIPGTVVGDELDDHCESIHRPTEIPVGPTATGEVLILAVVHPLEPGTIYIDGVKATHSRGPVHRTEHTGAGLEIAVR